MAAGFWLSHSSSSSGFALQIIERELLWRNNWVHPIAQTAGSGVTLAFVSKNVKRVLNMKVIYLFSIMLLSLSIAGCASTSIKTYRAAGKPIICDGKNDGLGHIVVLPETAWRNDQKEPSKRESMALEEIKNAFQNFPCGNLSAPGGIRDFSSWSSKPESELLKQFSNEGVDTIILLRIEELTPYLYFTFSLPSSSGWFK